MRHVAPSPRLLLAALCALVLLPIVPAREPAPADAQITQGGAFGSAVPCLLGEDTFATTCFADTFVNPAPASDPALAQVGMTTKAPLAALGARGGGTNARIINGVGAIYGLAYDDGAVSGRRRLYAAAYTKRGTSFGPGGPGGVYVYDFLDRAWSLAFVVPGAGWERTRRNDAYDTDVIPFVGYSGLGDIEISPDGRELFLVNLGARRIERYDITSFPPLRGTPIPFDQGIGDRNDPLDLILAANPASNTAATRSDFIPFALEFAPFEAPDGPLLALGITDTARRAVMAGGAAPPAFYPVVYVATYTVNKATTQKWALSLRQELNDARIAVRMRDSQIDGIWASNYHDRGIQSWNPWHSNLSAMPRTFVATLGDTLIYPQPLLADIEFTRDGRRMYLGLRDRTGDQAFVAAAPPGHFAAVAQGDTLVYDLNGGSWALQTSSRSSDPANTRPDDAFVRPAPSDRFDDNRHSFDPAASPFHVENHQGSLATSLQGSGMTPTERLATTTLLGSRQSGLAFYEQDGGYWAANPNTLVSASPYGGGKAANLGDLELLCTYAFVSGMVWRDQNGDGVRNGGDGPIAGITLEAFQGQAATAPTLASATTGPDGRYRFALPPNTPVNIRVARAEFLESGQAHGMWLTPHNRGASDALDSDAHPAWGFVEFAGSATSPTTGLSGASLPMPLRESNRDDVDLGLSSRPVPSGAIGDVVWNDLDADGRQDAGEPGVPGVPVSLTPDPSSAAPLPMVTTTTDASGHYTFNGLPAGRYIVRFSPPAPYTPTRRDAAGDDTRDSDADAGTGYAAPIITLIDHATRDATIDLGLVGGVTDLAVELGGSIQTLVGRSIDYTVTVRNLSPGAQAQNVVLTHDLPPGTIFVSASGSPARAGQRLTWNLGRLAPRAVRSFTVWLTAPPTLEPPAPPVELVTRARVVTTSPEVTVSNNAATWRTQLVRPEIGITKSAPASVLVGDELIFTLDFHNAGSATANNVAISDPLAPGLTFTRFVRNPGGACGYDTATRTVGCSPGGLPPGTSGSVAFGARVGVDAPGAEVRNSATISTSTPGDSPTGNSASSSSTLLRPNPTVSVAINPSPFPVGENGALTVAYHNAGDGDARDASLTIELAPDEVQLGLLPSTCARQTPDQTILCALATLPPGRSGSVVLPVALPADFPADQLSATATIASATPERPADQADNTATARADVLRPNVYVDAAGPASIVGRGSVFWYTVDYGNLFRRSPALTRAADDARLQVTLPPEVQLIEAAMPPTSANGQTLTWELGTLAGQAHGQIIIVVQTDVDAGATLHLDATISTSTPGDDPGDNRDSVETEVVQPPTSIPQSGGDMRLAIRSELDPNSQDGDPANGVYLSSGPQIAWPAGEVLDFTPRLAELQIPGEDELPFPYEYRARVVGWSVASITIDGEERSPTDSDDRGLSGCRAGRPTNARPRLLRGCAYGYIGGDNLEAIRSAELPTETQLSDQAHSYWTQPPAPQMRDDVYLYLLDRLAPVTLELHVEVELQIVNAYPGSIGGIPLPEIPVVPLPDPERQLIGQRFTVTLLAPRSVVGPGSR
ncbi:MAG: SdrD B-like domain-containing protein [Chloroflexi bacterium OHK40]